MCLTISINGRTKWTECHDRPVAKSHLFHAAAPQHDAHLLEHSSHLYETAQYCDVCGVLHHNESGMCSQHEAAAALIEVAQELHHSELEAQLRLYCYSEHHNYLK